MFGYKREELIGTNLLDTSIMTDGQIAKAVSLLAKNALGCPTGPEEFNLQRKDGSDISVEILAYPVEMNGETMILGIARDVTERRKAKEQLEESYRRLQRSSDGIIQAVSLTVDMRDPYTSDHQRRVAQLAPAIAAEMGFSPDQIESIRVASLIHDMGKFAVPAEILSKPGRLDDTELQLIREHPKTGFDILSKIDLPGTIAQIVYQHHERMNGSGYPRGLAGENILPEARVLAVAEAVEAMTSHRPYRPALAVDQALQEIRQAKGILFDPEVVEACLRVIVINKFEFK
jgi:PAS domain S-box-containing protein/putative nucleotidyltransferase with HDIG domain